MNQQNSLATDLQKNVALQQRQQALEQQQQQQRQQNIGNEHDNHDKNDKKKMEKVNYDNKYHVDQELVKYNDAEQSSISKDIGKNFATQRGKPTSILFPAIVDRQQQEQQHNEKEAIKMDVQKNLIMHPTDRTSSINFNDNNSIPFTRKKSSVVKPGAIHVAGIDATYDDLVDSAFFEVESRRVLEEEEPKPFVIAAATTVSNEDETLISNLKERIQQQQYQIAQRQQQQQQHNTIPGLRQHDDGIAPRQSLPAFVTAVPLGNDKVATKNINEPNDSHNCNRSIWKCILLLLVVVVIVVVSVVVIGGGDDNDNIMQNNRTENNMIGNKNMTDPKDIINDNQNDIKPHTPILTFPAEPPSPPDPTLPPTMKPTMIDLETRTGVRIFQTLNVLAKTELSQQLDPVIIQTLGTPQFISAEWFTVNDTFPIGYYETRPEELIERLLVVVLYFASGNENVTIADDFPFLWQIGVPTCEWNNQDTMGIFCNADSRVIKIDLYDETTETGIDISGPLPTELGLFLFLQDLDIQGNNLIGTIPSQLGALPEIKDIDLSQNALTNSIPSQLGNLDETLESLNLAENNLQGNIPSQIGLLTKLQDLNLASNPLLSGTIALDELTMLQNINVEGNPNVTIVGAA